MVDAKTVAPKKRRWRRILLAAVLFVLLLGAVYPIWFPWALRPVAGHFGLRYEECERDGYTAFEMTKVAWVDETLSVTADRVRLQMPHRWVWSRLSGKTAADAQLAVKGWQFESLSQSESSSDTQGSTAQLLDELQVAVPPLTGWVHSIVLTNGSVILPTTRFTIPQASYRDGILRVDAFDARAIADMKSLDEASFSLMLSNKLASASLQFERDQLRWKFDGSVVGYSNRFDLNGWFDRSGWLPAIATLGTDSLKLPSELLNLGGYGALVGQAEIGWTNGNYAFAVNLERQEQSVYEDSEDNLSVVIAGRGDLQAVQLSRFEVMAPFVRASLDNVLTFEFSGSLEGWNTTLNLWVDLDQIESIHADGQLSGKFMVQPSLRSSLRANFSLSGAGIAGLGLQSERTSLDGLINWPVIQVTNLTAEMVSGGKLTSNFELNAAQRELKELHWNYDGPWTNSLPASVQLKALHAHGVAQGFWPQLTHTGQVDVAELQVGAFCAANAGIQWAGESLTLQHFSARLENGASSFEFSGNGSAKVDDGIQLRLDCDAMDLVTGRGEWNLVSPFQFVLQKRTPALELDLSRLELQGPGCGLSAETSIHWPSIGSGELKVNGLQSSDLEDFLSPEVPELRLPTAALSFSWDDGPLLLDFSGEGQWIQASNHTWSLTGRAEADDQALKFDAFHVDLNGVPCVELDGLLPVHVRPAEGWKVVSSESGVGAHFDLSVVEEGPIWPIVEKLTGLQVVSPTVEFEARGRLPDLRGELVLKADQLQWAKTNASSKFVRPDLDQVQMDASLTQEGILLRQVEATVLGQKIQAEGSWDITADNWTEWWQAVRHPDWQKITGRLQAHDAHLAAVSGVLPGVIAPMGRMSLDLSLEPGRRLTGHLSITNGATRFLKPIGSLRDISTDISLDGWDAKINEFSATLGGRPVTLAGDLSWQSDGDRRFNLQLSGENLSLIRDPDFFLRADLNLKLDKEFGRTARLTGEVNLQRSLLFRDFNSLLGFDREQPEQRPPYFSVPEPPFGGWELDVRVKGDHFLDVFSPAFKGKVSAGLQLLGTLREPFAVGAVTVDSGKVLFPFGTLQIERGRVDLMREDPYRPKIEFRAAGLNFGYDVTVEVEGALDSPNLTFQSIPPLTAQQILLMLSAGEIPQSDFSYSSTDKAGRVGFYIGKEFVNRFVGNTSTMERLTLRSGEYITENGKPTYMLEYKLDDRWSAFGEYNRFRDFNGGLKFKVLSK